MAEGNTLENVQSVTTVQSSKTQPQVELSKSEKFLKSLFAKATERGYTPSQLVAQCMKIDQLEKKYSKTFDELKTEFDKLPKEIASRNKKIQDLEGSIANTKTKKADLMKEYSADERNVREYVDARYQLASLGFPVDDLTSVKTCLLALKNAKYAPETIIEKLNSIADLEARHASLESEVSAINGELREKKSLLIQLRQLQNSGLKVDQVERIRDIVSKIGSRRGVNPEQSMARFESDVLKNYDLTLGLESDIIGLQETKSSLVKEAEEKKRSFEEKERNFISKLEELEAKYQNRKQEIQAYSDLRSRGVDGNRIIAWHELLSDANLDFGAIESELKRIGDLRMLTEAASARLNELQQQQKILSDTVSELSLQKRTLESTISSIKDLSLRELESSQSSVLSSVSENTEKIKQFSESTKVEIEATLLSLKLAAQSFTSDMSDVLKRASEETKRQSSLIETAERIGKYESVVPLLKLVETGEVTESEALVSMWSLTNIFMRWLGKQTSTASRDEMTELLKRISSSLDREIQTVGT